MFIDGQNLVRIFTLLAILSYSEAFFIKWGSDGSQSTIQKTWQQVPQTYRPFISYSPYTEQRKYQQYQYLQPDSIASQYAGQMQPIPISVPVGSNLTPVSLQQVQLVPCMCPVVPEEAEKLQEASGPGPYLAQSNYLSAQAGSGQNDPQKSGKQ